MNDLDYTPETLKTEEARDKTKAISSNVLDMIGIRDGKVTKPGPGISECSEDPEHLYKTRHPWSIYDTSEDDLKAGFERLREQLPKNGWKIVKYGPNESAAESLELTADSEKDRFSINAELLISKGSKRREEPMILVHVVSGCFRAPEGTNLDTEY
ncbi:hypothetical protein [Streptomyces luteolus]|uniref:Uncharacterized protein n=1 Tax=Streptomyces luteolus TaxID=3043615 RepID=A0ABT6SQT1_9ACTN|nr:hypothetical protein [Streptomyces sp. B-S-A12]MDI3417962.1 hypothetical protein [Streptomyces sp. B-S-A12]